MRKNPLQCQVFALLQAAAHGTNVRENLVNRGSLSADCLVFDPALLDRSQIEYGVCLATPSMVFTRARLSKELIRIRALWKHENLYFKIFRQKYFNSLLLLPAHRLVAIIMTKTCGQTGLNSFT